MEKARAATPRQSKPLRLLQVARYTPAFEEALAREFDVHPLWREADPAAFIAAHGAEFGGLLTTGAVAVDERLIEALPNLEVIVSRGVGYEKIDVGAARRHGVAVSNTPDVLTACVADLAVGALLCAVRNLCSADRFVRRGDWRKGRFPLATRVSGKRLGIVGLGRIGMAVAQRAAAFEMEIRYHNRRPRTDVPFTHEPALVELARWADFLVVTAAGGPSSHHLISAEVLDALGARGYLVNVARGSMVDEAALVAALTEGRVAGAALDVFEREPEVPAPLLAMDNVTLFPHIASSTVETFTAMEDLVLANLRSHLADRRLVTPVT